MSEQLAPAEEERQAIVAAKSKGWAATFATYARLSGPGWLQSALTLGGGTLASSLYLGVLTGFALLWLQPFAMALGALMMCAVGYVTLSIKERPFQAINRHLSPVLGWAWLLGALLANIIWALPQYALACGVLQRNLLPGLLGAESPVGDFGGRVTITVFALVICVLAAWTYDAGGWGLRLYEWILRLLVIGIVVCFVGVVVVVAWRGSLDWAAIWAGYVPNFTQLWKPAAGLQWLLDAVPEKHRAFWVQVIVGEQRNALFAAASAAVGVNSMFLLSYTMLRRGWDRQFRGLSAFDLWFGMFLPFGVVTSCIVIASATQFHMDPDVGRALLEPGNAAQLPKLNEKHEQRLREGLLKHDEAVGNLVSLSLEEMKDYRPKLTQAETLLAYHLERKDAFALSGALSELTGRRFAIWIFGIGVLAMTLSTISLQMLGCGFVVCEALGIPPKGWAHRLAILPAVIGVLGPFLAAEQARIWLALPTSMASYTLLPLAYITFFLAMNSKGLMQDQLPRGGRRVAWNVGMAIAVVITTAAAGYMIWTTAQRECLSRWDWPYGGPASMAVVAVLAAFLLAFHLAWRSRAR